MGNSCGTQLPLTSTGWTDEQTNALWRHLHKELSALIAAKGNLFVQDVTEGAEHQVTSSYVIKPVYIPELDERHGYDTCLVVLGTTTPWILQFDWGTLRFVVWGTSARWSVPKRGKGLGIVQVYDWVRAFMKGEGLWKHKGDDWKGLEEEEEKAVAVAKGALDGEAIAKRVPSLHKEDEVVVKEAHVTKEVSSEKAGKECPPKSTNSTATLSKGKKPTRRKRKKV